MSVLLFCLLPALAIEAIDLNEADAFIAKHYVVKGNSQAKCNAEDCSTRLVEDSELMEVQCCSDSELSGWRERVPGVWAERDVWGGPPDPCRRMNWGDADTFCKSQGGRLCTKEESEADVAAGSGCSYDFQVLWTSTPEEIVIIPDDDTASSEEIVVIPDTEEFVRVVHQCSELPYDDLRSVACEMCQATTISSVPSIDFPGAEDFNQFAKTNGITFWLVWQDVSICFTGTHDSQVDFTLTTDALPQFFDRLTGTDLLAGPFEGARRLAGNFLSLVGATINFDHEKGALTGLGAWGVKVTPWSETVEQVKIVPRVVVNHQFMDGKIELDTILLHTTFEPSIDNSWSASEVSLETLVGLSGQLYSLKSSGDLNTGALNMGQQPLAGSNGLPSLEISAFATLINDIVGVELPIELLPAGFKITSLEIGVRGGYYDGSPICLKTFRAETGELDVSAGLRQVQELNDFCDVVPEICAFTIQNAGVQVDFESAGLPGCDTDDSERSMITFFGSPSLPVIGEDVQLTVNPSREWILLFGLDVSELANTLHELTGIEGLSAIGNALQSVGLDKYALAIKKTAGERRRTEELLMLPNADELYAPWRRREESIPLPMLCPILAQDFQGMASDDFDDGLSLKALIRGQNFGNCGGDAICEFIGQTLGNIDLELSGVIPTNADEDFLAEAAISGWEIDVGSAKFFDMSFYFGTEEKFPKFGVMTSLTIDEIDGIVLTGKIDIVLQTPPSLALGFLLQAATPGEMWTNAFGINQLAISYMYLEAAVDIAWPPLPNQLGGGAYALVSKNDMLDYCYNNKDSTSSRADWNLNCLSVTGNLNIDRGPDMDNWFMFEAETMTIGQMVNIFLDVPASFLPGFISESGFKSKNGGPGLAFSFSTNGFDSRDHDLLENLSPDKQFEIPQGIYFKGLMDLFGAEVDVEFLLNTDDLQAKAQVELPVVKLANIIDIQHPDDSSRGPLFLMDICGSSACGDSISFTIQGVVSILGTFHRFCNVEFTMSDSVSKLRAEIDTTMYLFDVTGTLQAENFHSMVALMSAGTEVSASLTFDTGGFMEQVGTALSNLNLEIGADASATLKAEQDRLDEESRAQDQCIADCNDDCQDDLGRRMDPELEADLLRRSRGTDIRRRDIWGDITDTANREARKITDAANRAADEIEATARAAADGIEATARAAAQGIEDAARTVAQGIEDAANLAADVVEAAAQTIKETAEQIKAQADTLLASAQQAMTRALCAGRCTIGNECAYAKIWAETKGLAVDIAAASVHLAGEAAALATRVINKAADCAKNSIAELEMKFEGSASGFNSEMSLSVYVRFSDDLEFNFDMTINLNDLAQSALDVAHELFARLFGQSFDALESELANAKDLLGQTASALGGRRRRYEQIPAIEMKFAAGEQ